MKSLYLAFLVLPLSNLIEKIFSRSRMRQTADRWTHPKSGDGPVQPCPGCWLIPMSFSGGLPLANRRSLPWKSWDNPPCPQSWKPKLHWRSVSTLPLACVVQSLSSVRLFAMPWSAACQPPSFTISWSLLKLMSIQPSHPLSPPPPPVLDLSQHQGLFQWTGSSHQVARVLEFQLQHQSFQWIFRTDFLYDGLVGSPCSPRDSQESSPAPQFESINSLALSFLYSPTLTSIHDYWKNHSFD